MSDFVFPQDGTTPDILGHYPREGGLTKRELFAVAALSGLLACPTTVWEETAKDAVTFADALLTALNANPRQD